MATKKPNKAQIGLMAKILEAYTDDQPFAFMEESRTAKLVDLGLVEVNLTMKDEESGGYATRLTPEGLAYIEEPNSNESNGGATDGVTGEAFVAEQGTADGGSTSTVTSGVVGVTNGIEIEDGIAVPVVRRRQGGSIYPFDALEVGQSFHIAVTEDKPNPAKSLASTVSAATKRSEGEKKFIVRAVGETDPKGPGARVFRVEVDK